MSYIPTDVTADKIVPMMIVGPDDIRTSLEKSKRFPAVLSRLLSEAKISGTPAPVHVRACTLITGTPHTKGLKLKSPDNHSVQFTWHEDSNDRCILFRVSTPPNFKSVSDFDAQLRAAVERIASEREAKRLAAQNGSHKREPAKQVTDAAPAVNGRAADATPEATSFVRIKMDDDMFVQLIVRLLELMLIQQGGKVAREKLYEVLIADFSFSRETMGPSMRSATASGYLENVEGDEDRFFVRVGTKWLGQLPEKFRPSPAKPLVSFVLDEPRIKQLIETLASRKHILPHMQVAKVRIRATLLGDIAVPQGEFSGALKTLFEKNILGDIGNPDFYEVLEAGQKLMPTAPIDPVPPVKAVPQEPAKKGVSVTDIIRVAKLAEEASQLRQRLAAIVEERKPADERLRRAQAAVAKFDEEVADINARLSDPAIAEAEALLKEAEEKLSS